MPTNNITISPFQPGDLEGVVSLINREMTADPTTSANFQRRVLLDLNFDVKGAPVARDGDKIVGFMCGMVRKYLMEDQAPDLDRGYITLLAVDRPILLRLHASNTRAWALLLGADARSVRLELGGQRFDVDRQVLQAQWDGSYAGLWRGPAVLRDAPDTGTRGPAVDWLWLRLLPQSASADAAYDTTLRDAVRNFQNARGLPTDGVAGPLTLMALANGLPGPRLLRALD